MSAELLAAAREAVALAKKHGARDAAANANRSRQVQTTWRDGKVEKISEATTRGLSLSLFVDGRWGAMSTTDLRPDALERFVAQAVSLVRALAEDPHRKLPDPSLYEGRTTADLALVDASFGELGPDARVRRARAIEEGARAAQGKARILSVTTSVSDWQSETARVASNGFEGAYGGTGMSQDADVTVEDADGKRPAEWASAEARWLGDLPDPSSIGREAAERAIAARGAKKIASGAKTVIVEARAARRLLSHFTAPLWGGSIQQKESFFAGKIGAAVASPTLTLADDPLLVRGLASRPYDGEGMAAKRRVLVEKGALRAYLLDVYYASKLGMAPTTGRATNLVVAPGAKGLDALLRDVKDGVLVTRFLGGNSNGTTGAFSLGIAGFRIARGERAEPIAEMNLAGKHLDFWKHLVAVGSDTYPWSSTRTPSLVFEGASVAGT